jgi:uncharacterized protein YjbI with pentapeptide repeats
MYFAAKQTNFAVSASGPRQESAGVRRWLRHAVLALLTAILPLPALADCADPPAPRVDWRKCILTHRQFSGVDLTGARLKDSRFTRTDFSGANLSDADLRRAKFIDANMAGVKLDGARLAGADFTKADLSGASMRGVDLARTQLQRANLRGADLTDARLYETDMLEADLSGATWIDGKTVCAEGSISQCRRGAATGAGSG